MEWMIGRQKRLLATQDRRIRALGIVVAIDLPRSEVDTGRSQQGRVTIAVNQNSPNTRGCLNSDGS